MVAAAMVGAVRAVGRVDHPIPARQRRTFARIGLSNRRRTGHRTRAARHIPRCLGHTRPRRSSRARSTPAGDRRRAWGAGRPPCQEGRSADGLDDHGVGWQLCGDQHTVRLTRARGVPDHGSRRRQRDDAEPGGAARSARLGHRGAGLRRSRQLDRPRQLFPRADVRAARGATDVGQPGLGSDHGSGSRPARVADPLCRTVASSDRAHEPSVGDAGTRPTHRLYRDGVSADLRTKFHPGAVLRTGRTSRSWSKKAPITQLRS